MWLIPTKKEIKKEFEKVQIGFKERDATIEKLRDKIDANALKIATIEGLILVNSQKSQFSVSQPVSSNLKASQGKYETRLIQHIKNNKKALVMAELLKLEGMYSVNEIFNKIVKERGLCSKASFYRYIDSLKRQKFETKETAEAKTETLKHKSGK